MSCLGKQHSWTYLHKAYLHLSCGGCWAAVPWISCWIRTSLGGLATVWINAIFTCRPESVTVCEKIIRAIFIYVYLLYIPCIQKSSMHSLTIFAGAPLGLLECAETMLFVSLWNFISLSSDSLIYISFHDSYSKSRESLNSLWQCFPHKWSVTPMYICRDTTFTKWYLKLCRPLPHFVAAEGKPSH